MSGTYKINTRSDRSSAMIVLKVFIVGIVFGFSSRAAALQRHGVAPRGWAGISQVAGYLPMFFPIRFSGKIEAMIFVRGAKVVAKRATG
jgi:hypothetical protein